MRTIMTRASFVTFLMWLFVFCAAITGKRAAYNQQNAKWYMRCSFKKAIVFLFLATIMGVFKLTLNIKMMHQMKRFQKENESN